DHLEVLTQFVELLEMDLGKRLPLDTQALAEQLGDERDRRTLAAMVAAGLMPARATLAQFQALLRVFAANLNASYQPAADYPGEVVLLNAQAEAKPPTVRRSLMSPAEAAEGWSRYAVRLREQTLQGDHMSVLKSPHVGRIAAAAAAAWPAH
ncbi:hypothetical protein QUV13_22750, partial [Xanthomonas citri pv. citri]